MLPDMRHILVLVALLTFAVAADAQITHLKGSGCKNAGTTPISGAPKIGGSITIVSTQLPCNSIGTSGFIILNVSCAVTPPLPIGCFGSCAILLPDFLTLKGISQTLKINIPNDSKLIGAKFCAQGGCLNTFQTRCIFPLNQAAQIVITK